MMLPYVALIDTKETFSQSNERLRQCQIGAVHNITNFSTNQLEYSFDLESYMPKFHNACADNYIYEFRCGCYLQSDCNCGPFQFPQSKVPNGTPIRLSSTRFQKQQCQKLVFTWIQNSYISYLVNSHAQLVSTKMDLSRPRIMYII